MKTFKNRNDEDFINSIKENLTLESLRRTAININTSKDDDLYTKCIRIDIMGICASLFFDRVHKINNYDFYDSLKEILDNISTLNKEGYFVKIRILLLYPYSVTALSRMQAEFSCNRATIKEPAYMRDFTIIEQIDNQIFWGSSFNTTQQAVLLYIQDIKDGLAEDSNWTACSKNKISLKFSTTNINTNCILINNTVYSEPYLFAKDSRYSDRCELSVPILMLDDKVDGDAYKIYEDHFRYIWLLDTTLDDDDATEYSKGKSRSLTKILPPSSIDYHNKAIKIREYLTKAKNINQQEVSKAEREWKSYVIHELKNYYSKEHSLASLSEEIFISCCWPSKNQISSPLAEAVLLKNYLSKHLEEMSRPLFFTNILESKIGESLSKNIYDALNKSTLGIVFLTKDIVYKDNGDKFVYYSKPNVYHELGYLMKHLGGKKVLILAEEGVHIPSNVQDITRLTYSISLNTVYPQILDWLESINIINIEQKKQAYNLFWKHIRNMYLKEGIEMLEFNVIKRLISKIISVSEE